MVRDRIVFGVNSHHVREKLLNEGATLNLDRAIDIGRARELSKSQMKSFATQPLDDRKQVNAINKRYGNAMHKKPTRSTDSATVCSHCGSNAHVYGDDCPAKGRKCAKCGKWNHFAKVCKSGNPHKANEMKNHRGTHHKKVDAVTEEDDLYIDAITHNEQAGEVYADVSIDGHSIKFKLDTGSQPNILPHRIYQQLGRTEPLMEANSQLSGYGGSVLNVKGVFCTTCTYKNIHKQCEFHVVDTNKPAILCFSVFARHIRRKTFNVFLRTLFSFYSFDFL